MARLRTRIARAAVLQQQAAAAAGAASRLLQGMTPMSAIAEQLAEQSALAARLHEVSDRLAPSWLGVPLETMPPDAVLGALTVPTFIRVGQARPLDNVSFPVIVPLLHAGHIAIDGDARDPRVAALLRSLVLRLLAATPAGSWQIRVIDGTGIGTTFDAFCGSLFAPSAATHDEMCQLLSDAEEWVADNADHESANSIMLLIIASLPELTDGYDLARISALAATGPVKRLHIIATGWPPPPLTAETTQRPLAHCTQITLRNPFAWVGNPPGTRFTTGRGGPSRLNAPVELDADPPAALIRYVCDELRTAIRQGQSPGTRGHSGRRDDTDRRPPQPEPQMWNEYVAAAQRLDDVRKESAALVAKHNAAQAVAMEDLALVQNRLAANGACLSEIAGREGVAQPSLVPCQDMDISSWDALIRVGPPSVAVFTALRGAHALLDEEETMLSDMPNEVERSLFNIIAAVSLGAVVVIVAMLGCAAILGF